MSTLKNVKAIVFDAYGTLFDVASINKRLAFHYGPQATPIGEIWRRKQLEYTWLRTMMGQYKDFYRLTADDLNYALNFHQVQKDVAVINDLLDHYNRLDVYPEVANALQELKTRFTLAILSNANPELLQKAVAHNEIDQHLTAIFSVDSLQKFKPRPEVYALPANGLQISMEQIAFVSSNTWDVAGAKSAGLKVIWIQRRQGVLEELDQKPDLVVEDLADLSRQMLAN